MEPWEKYQTASATQEPWERYKGTEPAPQEPKGYLAQGLDALKNVYDRESKVVNGTVQSAANGMTLGYLPQIEGGLSAAGSAVGDLAQGNGLDRDKILKDYVAARDHAINYQKQVHDDAPVSYNIGEFGGAAASPANKALAPFQVGAKAPSIAKIAAGLNNGAVMGAAVNPGDTPGVVDPLQGEQRANNAKWGAGLGAALTGGFEGAKKGGKYALSTFFGPSTDAIDKYVANRNEVMSTPTVEQMKNQVDGQVGKMSNAVDVAQQRVQDAKGALSDFNNNTFAPARTAATTEYQSSMPALNDAENAIPHPRTMANDVHQAVGQLKGQVVDESGKAREILANSNIGVQTQPVLAKIDEAIQDHIIAGQEPVTPSAKASLSALRSLREDLAKYPAMLSGVDAKRFVQQLDEDSAYVKEAGGFGDKYNKAIIDARRAVDGQLKGYAPYEQQMEVVAGKTRLLDRANKAFGTPEKAHGAMNTIVGEGKAPQQELLQELGAHTGNDFVTPIQNHQQQTKNIQILREMAPHLKNNYVDQAMQELGLPAQQSAKQAELERLQAVLTEKQQAAEPYSGWGPDSTQAKLQGLISKPQERENIEARKTLEALDALRTPDQPSYMTSIDNNRTRDAFTKDYARGSRNTHLWKALGGIAGGAYGAVTGGGLEHSGVLAGGGAVVGGAVDKYGGQMAKGILDNYLDNPQVYQPLMNSNPQRAVAPWLVMRKDKK